MKLILTPNDKKALLIAAIILSLFFGAMSVAVHYAPLAYIADDETNNLAH
jgi:hypothetical protein